jgi:hypothetical protein
MIGKSGALVGAFVIVRRGEWSRRRRRVAYVGCRDELTSASSIPVPAGFSKSGAHLWQRSPEPCRQSRYRAAPTIHGRRRLKRQKHK